MNNESQSGELVQIRAFDLNWTLVPWFEKYGNGRLAIQLVGVAQGMEDGEPFGMLTVNIPEVHLEPNEIIVKEWSENAEWAAQVARKLGYIRTTRYVQTGFVEAFIWEKV